MFSNSDKIAIGQKRVLQSYASAETANKERFMNGDDTATSEYIFQNQKNDSAKIVDIFLNNDVRVVSIQKKTKVGADGLMIQIATDLSSHKELIIDYKNVRIITGMSNVSWEQDMIDKAPDCFKDKIFHHGKLPKTGLVDITNGLIIIDEIDSGSKEMQVLHTTLIQAGMLDIENMNKNNNRFIFVSATMLKQLYDLKRWGNIHQQYTMEIPPEYIGHSDMLELGIIQEFYKLTTIEDVERWIEEDILDNYEYDFRVHIVRVNPKSCFLVQSACAKSGIAFYNHTSAEKLTDEEKDTIFKKELESHVVIAVKGLFRRANLIPNSWKMRIGAMHELYTKKVDNNVQVQGLVGRMTGYWRSAIESGHKTGPYRTSIKAIEEYEANYVDPFGNNSYSSSGIKKVVGKVRTSPTMLSAKNIKNLEAVELPEEDEGVDINLYRIYSDEDVVRSVCQILGYTYKKSSTNAEGFKETSLRAKKDIVSLVDAVKYVPKAQGGGAGGTQSRRYYPCYVNTADNTTLRFVVIIEPSIDKSKVVECDARFTSVVINS